MKPMRIGNVEYRETAYISGKEETYEEIILWYPNSYYGSEEKMKSEGWIFDAEGDAHKDNCHVYSGMFQAKEMCYTVAFIEWNNARDEFDVRSCGTRAFNLKDEDYKDFKKILELIEDGIH